MHWPSSSTSLKSLRADRRPSWNYLLRISQLWSSGCQHSSFPSSLLAIRRVQQRTCINASMIIPITMKTCTYCCCTKGNNGNRQLRFFVVRMWWDVILLELVSEACRTVKESGLDEFDETRVEVDLDVSEGIFDHPDRLEEKSQIIYWKEEERTYIVVFIHSPVLRIYVYIILDQCMDTLRTSIADAELENCDLVWSRASKLSTVMR